MRVLWDGTGIAAERTGMSNYSASIIENIVKLYPANEYHVILKPGGCGDYAVPHGVTVFERRIPNLGIRRELEYLRLGGTIASHFDVFHCLTGNWPLAMKRGICTFHDVRYFSRPNSYDGFSWGKSLYLRGAMRNAMRRCSRIIAISSATRDEIVRYGRLKDANHISVIHHGFTPQVDMPASDQFLSRMRIRKPYILYVGELKRHKNVVGLVRAFNAFKARYDKSVTQLVLVGKKHAATLEEIERIKSEDVRIMGHLPAGNLACLYQNASLFALLSFIEGFGFPLLEAMHYGVPIICSNIPALTEVAGDAAVAVSPEATHCEQTAAVFARVLNDHELRQELQKEAEQRIRMFRWEETARRTYAVYQDYLATVSRKD